MTCYHPRKNFKTGGTLPSGATEYIYCSYHTVAILKRNNVWEKLSFVPSKALLSRWRMEGYQFSDDFIEIPCGHCIGCRLKKSRDWATRAMLELQDHEESCFITLTYDDHHLPPRLDAVDTATGEIGLSPVHSLDVRDWQLFMKSLRKSLPDRKIRFLGCGEYGPKNMRPHFHAIIFGWCPSDLVFFKQNYKSQPVWTSPTLAKIWHRGFVTVGQVTFESCAYVARYTTKKLDSKFNLDQDSVIYGYRPEFLLCSRKPGIAHNYYDVHVKDIYKTDEIIIRRGIDNAIRGRPPKYFDKLYDIDYPEDASQLKEKRRLIAESSKNLKLSLTNLNYLDMLNAQEHATIKKTLILRRDHVDTT
ncbi:replication initiator protein [Capybara microvirus Cap1_SP_164]|nr:replication initiator protein [Capybara microvirus Cap1_SP_164]